MRHRVGAWVLRRRYGGVIGGAPPDVALFLVGSDYHVFSGNVSAPDAYFNISGADVVLQTGASSGLTITDNGNNSVQLSTP